MLPHVHKAEDLKELGTALIITILENSIHLVCKLCL